MRVLAIYDLHGQQLYQAAGDVPATELALSLVEMNALALFGDGFTDNSVYKATIKSLKESKDFSDTQSILSSVDMDSHIIEI